VQFTDQMSVGLYKCVLALVKACLRKDLRYDRPHAKAVRLRVGSLERVRMHRIMVLRLGDGVTAL